MNEISPTHGQKIVGLNSRYSIKTNSIIGVIFLLMSGCVNHFASLQSDSQREKDIAFDEMRIELADLRHTLQAQRTEIHLLQERIQEQEGTAQAALKERPRSDAFQSQVNILDKKLMALEKQHEHVLNDLKFLAKHYEQTGSSLSSVQSQLDQHTARLNEIHQLKSTLSQVSRAISEKHAALRYRVKTGDTLEKIARNHHISVAQIKKFNRLSDDRIFVGQELTLSQDE